MTKILNKFYKNHSFLYKIFLFVSTTFLIVYLFPKSGNFKYSFDKGKPWQSENLYAPFDFAIQKSNEEIQKEKELVSRESTIFIEVDTTTLSKVKVNYRNSFDSLFFEIPKGTFKNRLYKKGISILDKLYLPGVLAEDYLF